MSIGRYGPYIEFRGENGLRYVARVNAVAMVSDVDEMADETHVTVAGLTIHVRVPLDEVRDALLADGFSGQRARS